MHTPASPVYVWYPSSLLPLPSSEPSHTCHSFSCSLTIKMPPNGILGFSSNFGLLFIFYSHRQLALLFTFSKTQILCRSHSLFEMCVEERDNAHRLCSESFGTMIVSSLTLNFAWIGSYFPYF